MDNRASNIYPTWTPTDLADWLSKIADKLPKKKVTLYQRLAIDERMREVWEWHDGIRDKLHRAQGGGSVSFVLMVESAMRMPGKPGNMSPKQRTQYLESVRHHAQALIELLGDTRFDCAWDGAKMIDTEEEGIEEKIGERVLSAQSFVDSESGGGDIPVAYSATPNGLYQLPWDHPESHLTEILHEVCAWTHDDDYWGRGGLVSSRGIRQTGPRARVIRFNCMLYEAFARVGIEMPFPLLATVANVALELPADRQTDEDTVRKQVRRHLKREGHPKLSPRLKDSDLPF